MRVLRPLPAILLFAGLASAQQQPPPSSTTPPDPGAHVLFSRSLEEGVSAPPADDSAVPATPASGQLPQNPAGKQNTSPATAAERQAVSVLSYDLDIRLQPSQQTIAVRALMVLRNDGEAPLLRIPLQLSSTLSWTGIRVGESAAAFTQGDVESDADHTGSLHEAIVSLNKPLPPQGELTVDATYEGAIPASAGRLEQIGVPADLAAHSDWDRIDENFIGLRGFGNVVWYPVASIPAKLGVGNRLFSEIAAQRQRQSMATIKMRLTAEFFGPAPNLAVLDGVVVPVRVDSLPPTDTVPGIATCTLPEQKVGFAAPSLFLLDRTAQSGNGIEVFARTEDAANGQAYMTAATMVTPMISWWMGDRPKSRLSIVDLPEAGDSPFEDGGVLFTNVQSAEPEKLAGPLIHLLTHAYFQSPYPWLQEGAANFMATLWLERERGRDAAIREMDDSRGALTLVEPGAAAAGAGANEPSQGETLLAAKDPVYYRTKATYIFWMLRDVAGDDALARAFRAYQPGADTAGTGFQQVLQQASGKNLKWFFDDWVYHDRGLPDLSISGVYPNSASIPGAYIVSVDVSNAGSAGAEVPVSVISGTVTVTERLLVPAKSKISHRFLVQGQPTQVAVNDGTVPEADATIHRRNLSFQIKDE